MSSLSSFETKDYSFAKGGSDARARLQRGDAVFVNAVAEGHMVQPKSSKLKSMGHLFTGLLFALFVLALLLAIMVGSSVYKALNSAAAATDEARLSTSLIANTIRANDYVDAFLRGKGPEGDALVLVERTEQQTFQTRIYKSGNKIVEEFALADKPYNPEKAIPIVVSEKFDFEYKNGLLTVWTDEGRVDVALRCTRRAVQ